MLAISTLALSCRMCEKHVGFISLLWGARAWKPNRSQNCWLNLPSTKHKTIFLVGNSYQSIAAINTNDTQKKKILLSSTKETTPTKIPLRVFVGSGPSWYVIRSDFSHFHLRKIWASQPLGSSAAHGETWPTWWQCELSSNFRLGSRCRWWKYGWVGEIWGVDFGMGKNLLKCWVFHPGKLRCPLFKGTISIGNTSEPTINFQGTC